jgi:hypothetical protein
VVEGRGKRGSMTLVNSSGQVGQASVSSVFVGILITRICVENIVRVVKKKN